MNIATLNRQDLVIIASHLREWDRREIFATMETDSAETLADMTMQTTALGWVFGRDRQPIAAAGAFQMWPTVWCGWCFGTDRFASVGLGVTRHIRKVLFPAMLDIGLRRLECKSMEGHVDAHRWLESLGAKREATHPHFGRDGETFHTYAWMEADVERLRR